MSKLDANFHSLQPESAYFVDFILFFGFIRQKIILILAISREFDE